MTVDYVAKKQQTIVREVVRDHFKDLGIDIDALVAKPQEIHRHDPGRFHPGLIAGRHRRCQSRRLCPIIGPMPAPSSPPSRPDKDVQAYFRGIYKDYQDSVGRETIAGVHERIKASSPRTCAGSSSTSGPAACRFRFGRGPDGRGPRQRLRVPPRRPDAGRPERDRATSGPCRSRPAPWTGSSSSTSSIISPPTYWVRTSGTSGPPWPNLPRPGPGGRLFIIDSTTTRAFDLLQRWVYTISYAALKALGSPMVFMFSVRRPSPDVPGKRPRPRRCPDHPLGGDERGQPGSCSLGSAFPLNTRPSGSGSFTAVEGLSHGQPHSLVSLPAYRRSLLQLLVLSAACGRPEKGAARTRAASRVPSIRPPGKPNRRSTGRSSSNPTPTATTRSTP